MQILRPSARILTEINPDTILDIIEIAGRTCYKSEHNMSDTSKYKFVKNIYNSGHHSVLEHVSVTARFICSRGVSHELVRHRIAAYSQESTRYCNYAATKFNNQITVIYPFWALNLLKYGVNLKEDPKYAVWEKACMQSEAAYFEMLDLGASAQEARGVLPTDLKTDIVMTANLREWLHFFELRCDSAAHPDMQYVAKMLLEQFHKNIPVLFDQLYDTYLPYTIHIDLAPDVKVTENE